MKKINSLRDEQEKKIDSIAERMKNINSLMEKLNSLRDDHKQDVSVNESVNENDNSKDDELAVAQFGPGRE